MNFTHLSHKTSHISPSKTMYIYTFAIVTVYIYVVTVTVYTIILLISQFLTFFFSLFSVCKVNSILDFSFPHLLFPQIHTNTPTQTYIRTDKSIQKYTPPQGQNWIIITLGVNVQCGKHSNRTTHYSHYQLFVAQILNHVVSTQNLYLTK